MQIHIIPQPLLGRKTPWRLEVAIVGEKIRWKKKVEPNHCKGIDERLWNKATACLSTRWNNIMSGRVQTQRRIFSVSSVNLRTIKVLFHARATIKQVRSERHKAKARR